jgi:endonuclease/exonuclease/phosphatase family metal-dependent hydrolase
MFYNVENYYDSLNDTLTNDDEFAYSGVRGWNTKRLYEKTERIVKVILAAGKWNPPVFVGLCEVENRKVLEFLTKSNTLARFNYKIIQKDSPDERGIDVAMIYRRDIFRPLDYQTIQLKDPTNPSFKTRDILKVSGVLNGTDTLHVFVNHWPSRYGGVMETLRCRKLASEALLAAIGTIREKSPQAKIICTGDFNDTPTDESMLALIQSKDPATLNSGGPLVNLAESWLSDKIQTIKSQYTWEVFDQWIVSNSFLKSANGYRFMKAEIMQSSFLLEPDIKFGGLKPKRTYVGYHYQDGFSDHLPVLLRIQLLKP